MKKLLAVVLCIVALVAVMTTAALACEHNNWDAGTAQSLTYSTQSGTLYTCLTDGCGDTNFVATIPEDFYFLNAYLQSTISWAGNRDNRTNRLQYNFLGSKSTIAPVMDGKVSTGEYSWGMSGIDMTAEPEPYKHGEWNYYNAYGLFRHNNAVANIDDIGYYVSYDDTYIYLAATVSAAEDVEHSSSEYVKFYLVPENDEAPISVNFPYGGNAALVNGGGQDMQYYNYEWNGGSVRGDRPAFTYGSADGIIAGSKQEYDSTTNTVTYEVKLSRSAMANWNACTGGTFNKFWMKIEFKAPNGTMVYYASASRMGDGNANFLLGSDHFARQGIFGHAFFLGANTDFETYLKSVDNSFYNVTVCENGEHAATRTRAGAEKHENICTKCGQTVEAADHTWGAQETVKVTPTQKGQITRTCSDCNYTEVVEFVPETSVFLNAYLTSRVSWGGNQDSRPAENRQQYYFLGSAAGTAPVMDGKVDAYEYGWAMNGIDLSSEQPREGATALKWDEWLTWNDKGLYRHKNDRFLLDELGYYVSYDDEYIYLAAYVSGTPEKTHEAIEYISFIITFPDSQTTPVGILWNRGANAPQKDTAYESHYAAVKGSRPAAVYGTNDWKTIIADSCYSFDEETNTDVYEIKVSRENLAKYANIGEIADSFDKFTMQLDVATHTSVDKGNVYPLQFIASNAQSPNASDDVVHGPFVGDNYARNGQFDHVFFMGANTDFEAFLKNENSTTIGDFYTRTICTDHDYRLVLEDDTYHKEVCQNCGDTNKVAHTFGDAVNGSSTCADCGHVVNSCDHDYEWEYSSEYHWLYCAKDCGAIIEMNPHDFSGYTPAGSSHRRDCNDCGYVEYKPHALGDVATKVDADAHALTCDVCGSKQRVSHAWGTPLETEDGDKVYTCSACGETKTVTNAPVETDPVETDPIETDPVETDPVETDPVETDPVETDPVETDPVDTDEGKGCKASVSVMGVALVVALGTAVTVVSKKKED